MASVTSCRELTKYYIEAYKDRFREAPVVNQYTARWGFDAILLSMSKIEAQALIDYYLKTNGTCNLDWLFYHYTEIYKAMNLAKGDEAFKKKLREETKKRVEEWRNK